MFSRQERSDDDNKAYAYALRLLTAREYGYDELLRKVSQKYQNQTAENAVMRCRENGLQSDERFAQLLCRHAEIKLSGPGSVKIDAMRRGLDPDELDPYLDEIDFDALALAFLQKRYASAPDLSYAGKRKMLAALYRRGFDRDPCIEALEQFCISLPD